MIGASDIFYGTVPLPDGRKCKAIVKGHNIPNSWEEKGGFELSEEEPLEIEDIDGADPADSDWEKEYVVDGKTITLTDFCIDWLIDNGKFEYWIPDYDD